MDRVAKIEVIEEKTNSFVLNGLSNIEEGQCIRKGKSVWKVSKRRWIRNPHVSLVLASIDGSWPVVGDEVEIILDPLEGENPGKIESDLIVLKTMQVNSDLQVVWISGEGSPKDGDILVDPVDEERKWEFIFSCSESKSSETGRPITLKGMEFIKTNSRLKILETIPQKLSEKIIPENSFLEKEQTNITKKPINTTKKPFQKAK